MKKNDLFSYLISKLIDWYKENNNDENYTDKFSKLFLLKMLFLVAAVKTEQDQDDLLDTFDNFYALRYGPVESDIYNSISADIIPNYTITDRGLIIKQDIVSLTLSAGEKETIDKAIEKLKKTNDNLINLSVFELVDITHKWDSWRKAFSFAQLIGSQSEKMDTQYIRNDKIKFFGNKNS